GGAAGRRPAPRGRALPTARDCRKYARLFLRTDGDGDGAVSAAEAAELWRRSGLPEGVLATVWDLSNVSRSGQLSFPEFVAAMHLIQRARAGWQLPRPPEGLPDALLGALAAIREAPAVLAAQGSGGRGQPVRAAAVAAAPPHRRGLRSPWRPPTSSSAAAGLDCAGAARAAASGADCAAGAARGTARADCAVAASRRGCLRLWAGAPRGPRPSRRRRGDTPGWCGCPRRRRRQCSQQRRPRRRVGGRRPGSRGRGARQARRAEGRRRRCGPEAQTAPIRRRRRSRRAAARGGCREGAAQPAGGRATAASSGPHPPRAATGAGGAGGGPGRARGWWARPGVRGAPPGGPGRGPKAAAQHGRGAAGALLLKSRAGRGRRLGRSGGRRRALAGGPGSGHQRLPARHWPRKRGGRHGQAECAAEGRAAPLRPRGGQCWRCAGPAAGGVGDSMPACAKNDASIAGRSSPIRTAESRRGCSALPTKGVEFLHPLPVHRRAARGAVTERLPESAREGNT
ncbi:unnamed protein product, partial [Prorocentrum cordatum]